MVDRYDLEKERTGRESGRDFGNERYGERGRDEFERERRHSGYGDRRGDFGSDRDPFERETQGRENRSREHFDRENFPRSDWRREPERGDYDTRGDWGRQGSWGTYGNRPDFNREAEWRRSGSESYSGGLGSYSGGMGMYGARERGRFTGRGPKGWQRSDERIREDINERLTDHPDIDAYEIDVQVKSGDVTLTGSVDDRYAKRLAEDVAESVSGVREVHNQLRVQQGQFTGQEQTAGRSNAASGMGNPSTRRS
jgi:hypothetical protein